MFSSSVPFSAPDLWLCANRRSRVYIEGNHSSEKSSGKSSRRNAARRKCPAGAAHHLQTGRAGAFFRRSQNHRRSPGSRCLRAFEKFAHLRAGGRKQSGGRGLRLKMGKLDRKSTRLNSSHLVI